MTILKRKLFTTGLKSITTIILIIYVISKINFNEFLNTLTHIKIFFLFLIFAITILQSLISTKAWQIALSAFNIRFKYSILLFYYYIGAFYSLSLPGTIGGDILKVYLVGNKQKKFNESFSSLIIQRIVGLLVFITLLVIPATLFSEIISDFFYKYLFIILICTLVSICLFVYFSTRLQSYVVNKLNSISNSKFFRKVIELINSLVYFKYKKRTLLKLICLSILVYGSSLLLRYVVYKSLNLDINLIHFFSIVIFVTFLVQVPISFAGIGIREGSYVFFFSQIGISPEIALTFSLLEFLPGMIINISAGGLYFISETKNVIKEIVSKQLHKTGDGE